jgi:hypothetical protein
VQAAPAPQILQELKDQTAETVVHLGLRRLAVVAAGALAPKQDARVDRVVVHLEQVLLELVLQDKATVVAHVHQGPEHRAAVAEVPARLVKEAKLYPEETAARELFLQLQGRQFIELAAEPAVELQGVTHHKVDLAAELML